MNRVLFVFAMIFGAGVAIAVDIEDGRYDLKAVDGTVTLSPVVDEPTDPAPDPEPDPDPPTDPIPDPVPPADPCDGVQVDQGYQCKNGVVVPDCSDPPAGKVCDANGDLIDRPAPTEPGTDPSAFPIVFATMPISRIEGVTLRDANRNQMPISALSVSAFDPGEEVVHSYGGMKESNLVIRTPDGEEKQIETCTQDDWDDTRTDVDLVHCAALSPRVSPDGKIVSYTKIFATSINPVTGSNGGDLPIPRIGGVQKVTNCFYTVVTGQSKCWDTPDGQIDMHWAWINNEEGVFVSDRYRMPDGKRTYPVYIPNKDAAISDRVLHMYRARIDGSGAINLGPHHDAVLHPFVLSDGNIISSAFRAEEQLAQGITTIPNQWWIMMTDQWGAHEFVVWGAHGGLFKDGDGKGLAQGMLAFHFLGEMTTGRILTGNYYRLNHVGGQGLVLAIDRMEWGVEGMQWRLDYPRVTSINPYGQEEDNPTQRDPRTGEFYGKASWPVAVPNAEDGSPQVMLTYCSGWCYKGLKTENANDAFLRGKPGANLGIYIATKFPSGHPADDMIKVVDEDGRHEFGAVPLIPYVKIYGKDMPDQQPPPNQVDADGTKICTLQVVDAYYSELYPNRPGKTPGRELGGTNIVEGMTVKDDLAAVAIYQVLPNLVRQSKAKAADITLDGHKLTLLGYAVPEEDGSMNALVPCETPIKMRGVNANGFVFIRDQITHSLRTGEERQCDGCHGGHSENGHAAVLARTGSKTTKEAFAHTLAYQRGPKPLSPTIATGTEIQQ